jgi:hypothetical protein
MGSQSISRNDPGWYLSGKTEENHGKLKSGYPITQPEFKLGAFQTQVYGIITTPTWPVTLLMSCMNSTVSLWYYCNTNMASHSAHGFTSHSMREHA